MKRILFTVALSALGLSMLATPSDAQSNRFYLQLDGGGSFFADNDAVGGGDLEYDPGYVFGGRLGYSATDIFRLELDVAYSDQELDEAGNLNTNVVDVDLSTLTVALGAYADFFRQEPFGLYGGGGIGVAFWEGSVEVGGIEVEQDEEDLMLFGEAGVSINMTDHVLIVPHYRLLWIDDIGDDEQFAHWLRLGLRFNP